GVVAGHRPLDLPGRGLRGLPALRPRAHPRRDLARPVRRFQRLGLPARTGAVRAGHRRDRRYGAGCGASGPRAVRRKRLHVLLARRGAGDGLAGGDPGRLPGADHPWAAQRARGPRQLRQAAGHRSGVHAGSADVRRHRGRHQAHPPDGSDAAVPVVRRVVAGGELRAGRAAAAAEQRRPHPPAEQGRRTVGVDRRGRHRAGGAAFVNTPVRRVALAVMGMIVLLMANLTYVQVVKAGDYRNDSRNQRVLLAEYSRQRGQISAAGQVLAQSVETGDRLRFQREHPDGPEYSTVTGFYSVLYSSSGIERSMDDVLNGNDDRLFARRLSDLITGRDPSGGSVVLTRDPAVQEAAYNAMTSRDFAGAVVALRPQTGQILAMVSTPTYDPNKLASHSSEDQTAAATKFT